MSLILEALKKLEREKRTSEPGFLVLGPTAWPSAAGGVRRTALVLAGLALLATALAVMVRRNAAGPGPSSTRAAAAASPAGSSGTTALLPPAGAPAPAALSPAEPKPAVESLALESPRFPGTDSPAPQQPTDRHVGQAAAKETVVDPAHQPATLPVVPPRAVPPPGAPQPRFRLQAISLRDGKPVAVLNDRLVYEGESFDGVRVVRIGDAEVELEVDGRRLVVGF